MKKSIYAVYPKGRTYKGKVLLKDKHVLVAKSVNPEHLSAMKHAMELKSEFGKSNSGSKDYTYYIIY